VSVLPTKKISSKQREEWKEWMPHWIHTDHLYVRERKTSKSLKNFVTVGEILGVSSRRDNNTDTAAIQEGNEWNSPANDF
jgi:cysteinyl-tRNA synthetase